jgi:hypothetical protein
MLPLVTYSAMKIKAEMRRMKWEYQFMDYIKATKENDSAHFSSK